MSRLRTFEARSIYGLALMALTNYACASVRETPAAIPQGGRAVAISVEPGTDSRMLVASETGGLFVTDDGGSTWAHVDGLPSAAVSDVAQVDTVALATTRDDFLTEPNGGIWRSTDRGRTWSKPPGSVPLSGPRCPDHSSAHGISANRTSTRILVGTDCGVAMSDNEGATWFHTVVDAQAPITNDRLQNRVWSVLSLPGPRVYAAGANGIAVSFDGGGNWMRSVQSPGGQNGVIHAFAVSPLNRDHVFVVGTDGNETNVLFMSTDAGRTWSRLRGGDVGWQRPGWVRTALSGDGSSGAFDLYFGAGRRTFRSRIAGASSPTAGPFVQVAADHSDPSDIAIGSDGRTPLLLATDGGVHRFDQVDGRWELTGAGPAGGYDALQVTEMAGQIVTGAQPHVDLYFATQDNSIWASADGGATWPRSVCCEGFHLRTPRRADADGVDAVTGGRCSGTCSNFKADSHLEHPSAWNDAPDGDSNDSDGQGQPFLIQGRTYIQFTVNDDAQPKERHLMLTTDFGTTWVDRGMVPFDLVGRPLIGIGPTQGPVLYNAIRRAGQNADGSPRLGLVRIGNLLGPNALAIDDADSGIESLGTFPTMFAWYRTFGVDPTNPDRLLAPDIGDGVMKSSLDGGMTWNPESELTDLVTSGSTYRFHLGKGFTLVSSIAWDPDNSCHVLVGTRQNGVLRSTDGGRTWKRIRGSERITDLSSFFFQSSKIVRATSYGRGLWRMRLMPVLTSCEPLRGTARPVAPVPGPEIWDSNGIRTPFQGPGKGPICPRCSYLLVYWGEITSIAVGRSGVIENVGISGGFVRRVGESGKTEALPQVTVDNGPRSTGASRLLESVFRQGYPVRGLVLEEGRIREVITSRRDLEPPVAAAPFLRLGPLDRVAGDAVFFTGETLRVEGSGFAPGEPLVWSVDGRPADRLKVGDDGRFHVDVPIDAPPGVYEVLAEQRTSTAVRVARELFRVVPNDQEARDDE